MRKNVFGGKSSPGRRTGVCQEGALALSRVWRAGVPSVTSKEEWPWASLVAPAAAPQQGTAPGTRGCCWLRRIRDRHHLE